MRRALRRRSGASLLEVTISLVFALAIVGGAGAVAKSSGDLAATSGMIDGASRRVQRVLDTATDEIRRISLGSVCQTDGTTFPDGGTANGFTYRRVLGFQGAVQLDSPMTIRWVRPTGSVTGDVELVDGPVVQTLARNVTDFTVTRIGSAFTVRVSVRMGNPAAGGRTASGSVTIRPRNS